MNSSAFFSTDNGSCYLYDANHQQLFNVHPILETIHQLSDGAKDVDITGYLSEKYPELSDADISRYRKKYDFLKTHVFFSSFDFDGKFVCHTSARQIENQMIHLDAVTFEVTGACNLNCRYCLQNWSLLCRWRKSGI